MQIESLNEKTILEQAVFDYLFSIEDVSKHDLKMYEFEDRASELKVKARFTSRYKNEKRARDKIKADERKRLSKEQIATQKQSSIANMTSFGAEDYAELMCGAWECDLQGVRITDYNGVKQACYYRLSRTRTQAVHITAQKGMGIGGYYCVCIGMVEMV